ncbi:hypothetical protein ETAA8_22210 [Anatilimnocola aggregata]|uniref:Uncharacterized protein n=1 Tax=Anatilimnocola aggregata TaxID=2528021 RepID=A0A517YA79_9BACT|nr:hypothetical protein [Anatilimnocola aggregata]QDU27136.1 hypothetical protein ETAA8_22210 [Anatilimnocola aggregata]
MPRVTLGTPDCRNITPLTIHLRIKFQPGGTEKPGESKVVKVQGKQIKLGHISPGELEAFKARFQYVVTDQWSGKLYIALPDAPPPLGLPTTEFRKFMYPGLARWNPCVQCKLKVELTDSDFDWWVIVCKPEAGQPAFPSYMYTPDKLKLVNSQGMPHGMLSLNDVKVSKNLPVLKQTATDNWNAAESISLQQVVAGHEVGHMLGLHHVNYSHPLCHEKKDELYDNNDPICYGDTVFKAADAMGYGSEVRAVHARPWLRVLKHLTGHKKGWRLTTDPLSLGCATPETLLEKATSAGKALLQNALGQMRGLQVG